MATFGRFEDVEALERLRLPTRGFGGVTGPVDHSSRSSKMLWGQGWSPARSSAICLGDRCSVAALTGGITLPLPPIRNGCTVARLTEGITPPLPPAAPGFSACTRARVLERITLHTPLLLKRASMATGTRREAGAFDVTTIRPRSGSGRYRSRTSSPGNVPGCTQRSAREMRGSRPAGVSRRRSSAAWGGGVVLSPPTTVQPRNRSTPPAARVHEFKASLDLGPTTFNLQR